MKPFATLAQTPLSEEHRSGLKGPIVVHLKRLLQGSPAMLSNEKQEQFGVIIFHIAHVAKKGRADSCQFESLGENLYSQGRAQV